jgi:hypothetical protein
LNLAQGDGGEIPYEIVPFPNGENPTLPPVSFPIFVSVNIIDPQSAQPSALDI